MPRKSGSAQLAEYDIRVTPSDQLPITKEQIVDSDLNDSEVVLVAEEGGTPQLRLHYHIYVKAKLSETKLRAICSKLGRATDEVKGNAVFSIRKAHPQSIGYIVKGRNIVYHNQSQTLIDQYYKQSEEYRKSKENERKSAFRKNEKTLADILKEVEVDCNSTAQSVVIEVLKIYHKLGMKFPPRSSLETATMTALYPHRPSEVESFYCRNLFSWK